jgi:hypothetical protein
LSVDIGDSPLLEAVVEPDSSPVGRLTVGVGTAVAVLAAAPVLTVWVTVGNRSGPVPDEGRMSVAIILVCVLGAALETPTHML